MMDPVTIQFPPVMPDTFYDHNAGYHAYSGSTTSLWPNRDESMRAYLAQGPEFESHIRHTGFLPRRTGVSNVITGNKESAETEQNDWTGTEGKGSDEVKEHGPYKQSQVAETLSCFCKQSSHLSSSFLRERVKRRPRDYRLSENYERAEGVCLPRCVLYQHYLDFCKKTKFTPAGAATFGKIIRQRFPKLTTRRLGTRGQSKYHYYGIGIKESSIYYHSVYSGKGLTRFSGIKIKTEGSNRKYSLSSKTGTLLPEFPNADNLILPSEDQRDKMGTFIMMYRTHCQRILDTVISANFDEVQNFLVHFWQGMPDHLVDILELDIVVDIIGLCDSILYKVLVDVLIPSTIQDLPDSLYSEMKLLAKRIPFWLETSMENIHKPIREKKMEVAKAFIHSLTRQASFVSLAQTARSVLTNHDSVNQMIEDLAEVDFLEVCTQAGFMESSSTPKFSEKLFIYYEEFLALLGKQAPIETYTEWLDDIIDKCVLQSSKTNNVFKEKAAEFLLQWEAFGALLLRDLTLRSAASFGSFHLVHILLDEYAFLVFETQEEQEREKELQKKVQQHMKNSEEIQTQPKLRNCSSKLQQSPKFRKRKHEEDAENDTTNDQDGPSAIRSNNHAPDICPMTNTTAFTRPTPATREAQQPLISGLDATTHINQTNIPMSSLRSYQGYNSGSYDRPTYLPQFGINYSDYSNPSLGGRLPTYSDSFSQTFPSNPFSALSPANSAYWPESRGHHTYTDPYHGYNYNKLSAQYENLNKSTILRNNVYQESLNRQAALDTTMPYYRTSHDNLQVCTPLTVGPYTGNFMDIAPTGSQYCRQDNLLYQDDLYPMATTLGKSYLTTPFR